MPRSAFLKKKKKKLTEINLSIYGASIRSFPPSVGTSLADIVKQETRGTIVKVAKPCHRFNKQGMGKDE